MFPIEEHGFAFHKGAFRDALCLQYGWLPNGLPAKCVCGHGFTVDHAMNCSSGGFPTLRHNELRDFTVATSSGESFWCATANVEGEAHLYVSTQGFYFL